MSYGCKRVRAHTWTGHSPHLRVSHEAIAEANSETVSMKSAVAVVLGDRVHVGRVSGVDSVALHALLRRDAPAIVHATKGRVSSASLGTEETTYIKQTLFLTSTMLREWNGERETVDVRWTRI